MSDHADSERWDSADQQLPVPDSVTVESYRTDGRVVFFDAENPLAWLETSRAVRLSERV